jgi:hypothetical protein
LFGSVKCFSCRSSGFTSRSPDSDCPDIFYIRTRP